MVRRVAALKQAGFMLTELAVTAAIVLLAAAVALPRLSLAADNWLADYRIDSEARYLVGELRYLAELARHNQTFSGDFAGASGQTEPFWKLDAAGTGYRISHQNKQVRRRSLPAGMRLTANRGTIYFRNGYADTTTIELTAGDRRRKVIVDVAGRVRLTGSR